MRRANKRDLAEEPIIAALERIGGHVWQQLPVDLIVWRPSWVDKDGPYFRILEVKSGKAKTRKTQTAQINFISTTGCQIARTPEEALRAIGAI